MRLWHTFRYILELTERETDDTRVFRTVNSRPELTLGRDAVIDITGGGGHDHEPSAHRLQPYTFFDDVRICAVNAAGRGSWSRVIPFVSTVSLPGAPANVRATAVSRHKVTLAWDRPVNDGSAQIDSYIVTYVRTCGRVGVPVVASQGIHYNNHRYTCGGHHHRVDTMSADETFTLGSGDGTPASAPLPPFALITDVKVAAQNRVGVGRATLLGETGKVFTTLNGPTGVEIVGVDRNEHLLHLRWDTVEVDATTVLRCVVGCPKLILPWTTSSQRCTCVCARLRVQVPTAVGSAVRRCTGCYRRPQRATRCGRRWCWRRYRCADGAGRVAVFPDIDGSTPSQQGAPDGVGGGSVASHLPLPVRCCALFKRLLVCWVSTHRYTGVPTRRANSVRALFAPVDEDAAPSWGEWSSPSNAMLLPAPEGRRPVRDHVRKLVVNHTGGGFTASTKEIER